MRSSSLPVGSNGKSLLTLYICLCVCVCVCVCVSVSLPLCVCLCVCDEFSNFFSYCFVTQRLKVSWMKFSSSLTVVGKQDVNVVEDDDDVDVSSKQKASAVVSVALDAELGNIFAGYSDGTLLCFGAMDGRKV